MQFHVQGDLNNYTKENIVNIVETVAGILNCRTDEILVNGVHHSRSFMLVLSMKDIYVRKLMTLSERDCRHLTRLHIDYFILNQKIFQLASSKGKWSISGILLYKGICRFLNFIKHLKIQMIIFWSLIVHLSVNSWHVWTHHTETLNQAQPNLNITRHNRKWNLDSFNNGQKTFQLGIVNGKYFNYILLKTHCNRNAIF